MIDKITQERIERILTFDGSIPAGYAFVVDGLVYVWNPNSHFRAIRIRTDALFEACKRYLIENGRVFKNLSEASDYAIRNRWLNWQKLTSKSAE